MNNNDVFQKLMTIKDDFIQKSQNSENYHLFIYTLCSISFGVNGFHMKYARIVSGENYDSTSFVFWRSVLTLIFPLMIIYKNNIKIKSFFEVENKLMFLLRTIGQMIFIFAYSWSLKELRVGTASSILSFHPMVALVLSAYILKERFHYRYLLGIIVCFLASLLIISNDRNQDPNAQSQTGSVILGTFWGVVALTIVGTISVASKMLVIEEIGWEVQCFYVGAISVALLLVNSLFFVGDLWNAHMIFHGLLNGVTFIIGTVCLVESVRKIDVSKTTSLSYVNLLTAFVLGAIILGEQIFLLDIIGSSVIIGYNIWNSLNPVTFENDKNSSTEIK